jgi:hypothetical protein
LAAFTLPGFEKPLQNDLSRFVYYLKSDKKYSSTGGKEGTSKYHPHHPPASPQPDDRLCQANHPPAATML